MVKTLQRRKITNSNSWILSSNHDVMKTPMINDLSNSLLGIPRSNCLTITVAIACAADFFLTKCILELQFLLVLLNVWSTQFKIARNSQCMYLISFDDPMSKFPDDHYGDNRNHDHHGDNRNDEHFGDNCNHDHDHYGQQPRQRESR